MLAYPAAATAMGGMAAYQGPNGPLAKFLSEFGLTLLKKYQPKGIVVFSAHWETMEERLGKSVIYIRNSRSYQIALISVRLSR